MAFPTGPSQMAVRFWPLGVGEKVAMPASSGEPTTAINVIEDLQSVSRDTPFDVFERFNFGILLERPSDQSSRVQSNLAQQVDKLRKGTIFKGKEKQISEVLVPTKFSPDQMKAMHTISVAPGGMSFVQGAAGTGKTYLATKIVEAYLCAPDNRTIVVVTESLASNGAVSESIDALIRRLRRDNKLGNTGYAVQVDSAHQENPVSLQAIGDVIFMSKRPAPFIQGRIDWENQKDSSTDKAKHDIEFHGTRNPHLHDMSANLKALEVADVIPGCDSHPDKSKFSEVRRFYENATSQLSPVNAARFAQVAQESIDFTIRHAMVVVVDATYHGFPRIMALLRDRVSAVIVDGLDPRRNIDYSALLTGRFRGLNGVVVFSDWMEDSVSHAGSSNKVHDGITAHYGLSFVPHLAQRGLAHASLDQQHRMNESLLSLANLTWRDGASNPHSSCLVKNRAWSKILQAWTMTTYGHETLKFVIDLKPGKANATKITRSGSRYNAFSVATAINLARQILLQQSYIRVAILTAHDSQKIQLINHLHDLQIKHPRLFRYDRERLTVENLDNVGGTEYSCVIHTIVLSDGAEDVEPDERLAKMAFTRAKHMYVMMADIGAVQQAYATNANRVRTIHELIENMNDYHFGEATSDVMPTCEFVPDRRF